jgi:hypothetical protein
MRTKKALKTDLSEKFQEEYLIRIQYPGKPVRLSLVIEASDMPWMFYGSEVKELLRLLQETIERQTTDVFAERNKFLDTVRDAMERAEQETGKSPSELTEGDVAKCLGLTARRLQQITAKHFQHIPSKGRGRWRQVKSLAKSNERPRKFMS